MHDLMDLRMEFCLVVEMKDFWPSCVVSSCEILAVLSLLILLKARLK